MRPRLAGPSTRRCALLAALMLLPQVARADLAWWLTERFKPAATAYEGLSARDIHPAWASFSVLTYAMLPQAARADLAWMRREGFAFEKDGDFNADGRPDRALAGVYRDKAGRTGRFLLVLERQGGTPLLEKGRGQVARPRLFSGPRTGGSRGPRPKSPPLLLRRAEAASLI